MDEDLERALDAGVDIKLSLKQLECLITAWVKYACEDKALYRAVHGKLERAQKKSTAALMRAELAHDTMKQVEVDKGWRMEGDDGFMPESY